MPKCKNCYKFGLFLKLNSAGICAECENRIALAKKKEQEKKTKAYVQKQLEPMYKQQKLSDAELEKLQKADKQYEIDNNIEQRIAVYESILSKKTRWNSFNYCMKLARMYEEIGQNDKAWRYLNKMETWFATYPSPKSYLSKISQEQFSILKKEKKYKDALRMLLITRVSYSDSVTEFNKEKFVKDAKPIAKNIGIDEEALQRMADEAFMAILHKENDVHQVTELIKKYT